MNRKKQKSNWADPATTAENERLSGWLKWVWTGRGLAFCINMVLMMQITYYCTDLLGLPVSLVGTLLLASKVVDACTDLIFGYVIDRTRTRWGKARPYEVFIALLWIGTVLLFSVPDFGITGKIVYVFILYTLVNSACATFVMASDPVYMSRTIRSEKNKMSVTAFQAAFILLGSTVAAMCLPQMIKIFGTEKSGWTLIALIFAVPLTIIGSIRMFTVKEVVPLDAANPDAVKTTYSVKEGMAALGRNKMILILCAVCVLNNAIIAVTQSTAGYYFKWVFGDIGMASLVSLPSMLTPVVLIFAPALSRKIGTGNMMRYGLIAAILGYGIRMAFGTNLVTIMLGSVLASVGMIPAGTLLSIYEMECMDYGEWKTGVRVEGMITSGAGFATKVGSALGSGLLGILMGAAGYVSSETAVVQSESAIQMIKILFNGIPLILAVIATVCAMFYTIDRTRNQMQADLAKKR